MGRHVFVPLGVVESVDREQSRVTVRRTSDGHKHTWRVGDKPIIVSSGQSVELNEVIAAAVPPLSRDGLRCPGTLSAAHVSSLLGSRERTQRFTGVKLARLREYEQCVEPIRSLAADAEEDIYVRLEAVSYLPAVCRESARGLFDPFLKSQDEQVQLEAVITLGESASPDAIELLCEILRDAARPFFLRSAAAWSLSQTRSPAAAQQLVQAFSDVNQALRDEALVGLATIGGEAIPALLAGLRSADDSINAGCAEALRRSHPSATQVVDKLLEELHSPQPQKWAIWLIGHLPREQFATAISGLQANRPELHYAISLLWSFVESWIARHWEMLPTATLMERTE